jgi:serine/threonine-protein kinase
MLPRAGDLIGGKYRIVRLIGDGGMGSVYEARHEGLGMSVALKFLHEDLAERPGLTDRFLREARVAATIQSPHVVHVTDVDVGPAGLPYLVMELLSGESLQHVLDRERKLTPQVALDFALQIAVGLEAAHAVGVVHRDLKPDNVFVTPGTGGPLLKLLDFGIAKLLANQEQRGLTRAGVVMGTAEYMPPEQLYAANEVDGRADVYALGVILFEMLSGRRPADGEDAQVIVAKVLARDVLSLAQLEPSLPRGLVELVERATAGDRDARIASTHELRAGLAHFATALSPAGAMAARAAPVEPQAQAATKTLPPAERDAFAKGSTEQAPPLGAFAMPPAPAHLPPAHLPPAPPPMSPARARRRGHGWLYALLALVLLGGGGAGAYAYYFAEDSTSLPPPPLETTAAPAPTEEAFAPEGQASAFTPTVTPGAPNALPAERHEPREPHEARATPSSQPGAAATAPATATAAVDAGTFPVPLQLPSTFPPIALPSGFPTTLPTSLPNVLPSVLPSVLPTTFPGLPGLSPPPPSNPAPSREGGR